MNYTKGEWKIGRTGTDRRIAIVDTFDDARLIAAAPDMYEALLTVYRDIDLANVPGGTDELNIIIQQALAKAEGRKSCR